MKFTIFWQSMACFSTLKIVGAGYSKYVVIIWHIPQYHNTAITTSYLAGGMASFRASEHTI
jgi:hypothetical protein